MCPDTDDDSVGEGVGGGVMAQVEEWRWSDTLGGGLTPWEVERWFVIRRDFWLSSGEGEAPSQLLLSARHDGADDDELLFKLKSSTCNLYLL